MRFIYIFFFSSRRRHTRLQGDWSSDVCSSDLGTRGWAPYAWQFLKGPAPQPAGEVDGPAGQQGLLVTRLAGISLVLRDRVVLGRRDAPGPTGSWRSLVSRITGK